MRNAKGRSDMRRLFIERKTDTGFTLVEIMVTVIILLILVAISTPSILRSRVTAYECAAIANIYTLSRACQTYHMDQQKYPDSLLTLYNDKPPYIDETLASGSKQGYQFIYNSVDSDHFTINANPLHTGMLKGRYFYIDETGSLRSRLDVPAGPDDPIVE